MSSFELDIKPLVNKFKELDGKERIKAQKTASGKALKIVKDATIQQMQASGIPLDKPNKKYKDLTPRKGVKMLVYKDGSGGSVNIMSNYVLRFLEGGTVERTTKRTTKKDEPWTTGHIGPRNFFLRARQSSESAAINILNTELEKAIQDIWNKR